LNIKQDYKIADAASSPPEWVGVGIPITSPHFIDLQAVEIENADVHYAEAAYILVTPSLADPDVAKQSDSSFGLVNGWTMDMRHLSWHGHLILKTPIQILGYVYHNSTEQHKLKAIWSELDYREVYSVIRSWRYW